MNQQKEIENKAKELRRKLGGKIFAFPINEDDPFSKYAVVIYAGNKFKAFPELLNVSEAASGILTTLEAFEKEGIDSDYDRNVRFISYDAQLNAPDVTMRRVKKDTSNYRMVQETQDFTPLENGEYGVSARGLIKFSYISMVNEKLPKAIKFMDEYYKLLAMRRYGRTAKAIKRQVEQMNKDDGIRWVEETYREYIHDDQEIMTIFSNLKSV